MWHHYVDEKIVEDLKKPYTSFPANPFLANALYLADYAFHDLRHTYTSLLIAQGENIKFIQSQLGHASIQTTMDRYGHILPNANHGVGERLDKSVFGEAERLVNSII